MIRGKRQRQSLRGPLLLQLAVAGAIFLTLCSCAWQVIPPRQVREPVPIFLSEYGRHTRLALPSDAEFFIEYGFGEWNFYGLEKQGVVSALRAISGLGEGAFSRRELPFTLRARDFLSAAGGDRTEPLWVERSLAEYLRKELESRWRANAGTVVIRRFDQVPVSRDPTAYHLFGNSNHAVANWLRRLGCRVRGIPMTSNFTVRNCSGVAEHQARQRRDGATLW